MDKITPVVEDQDADLHSPSRVNQTDGGESGDKAVEAVVRSQATAKPFSATAPPIADESPVTLAPGKEEDDGRSLPKAKALPYPIQVEEGGGSCSMVTGRTAWSPDMGVENFFLSQCREWRLRKKTELVAGPEWKVSLAVAPGSFQKYSLPFPAE